MKRLLPFLLFLVALFPIPAAAQDNQPPPVDPNSAWGEVLDADGNIRYDNLTDLGVVTETPDWMQINLPFDMDIQLEAQYHIYQTPTGNIVVLPSATTLFFMALNPQESGLNDASGAYFSGGSGGAAAFLALFLQGVEVDGYVNAEEVAEAIISGELSFWSFGTGDILNILSSLLKASAGDCSGGDCALYAGILLYTPDFCFIVPGGCPEGAQLPSPPSDGNDAPSGPCQQPIVQPGPITLAARKTAPHSPLVVGQDPDDRGADVTFELRIEPTIYTWWLPIPQYDTVCRKWQSGDPTPNCKTDASLGYYNGVLETVLTGYRCEQHTETLREGIKWATFAASLSKESRDWILYGQLQIRYPGAYLHNPYFSWPGLASFSRYEGDTFVLPLSREGVQFADPGVWELMAFGWTSGTMVSPPRHFDLRGEPFKVYLKEVVIIQ